MSYQSIYFYYNAWSSLHTEIPRAIKNIIPRLREQLKTLYPRLKDLERRHYLYFVLYLDVNLTDLSDCTITEIKVLEFVRETYL